MAEAIRVLYVDDESALLDLCQIFLERSGDFTVTTATNAPEALRILELKSFDAIVSDYQMPEMDGIEFLKIVRGRGDKTPFIIFTGKGREEVVIEALNSGADFYLQKGGEPKSQFAELMHKIRHAVSHRQADKALIASEEKYRAVFETTGAAAIIVEENTIISLANTQFVHLSGFTKEELEGKKRWTEFVVKEDLNRMIGQHKLRRTDREKALKQYEFRFITRSGEIRDIFLNVDVIPGTKKSVASLIDITGRKASEQTLKISQEKLAEALDLAHIANWEFDVASGIFTFNDRFYSLYGTTAEQEGGYRMPAEDYARKFVHPDEASLVAREVKNAITATDPGYTSTIEHRIIRRDGEIRHIIVRFGITKDADGRTVKTYGANQDITERKIAGDELRETNEYLHKLIDFANSPIIVWDPDLRITRFNHASEHLTGRVEKDVIGQPLDILLPQETRDASLALIKQTLAGERLENVEIPLLASDGIIHTVLWNSANILTAEADLISTIAQGVDITDWKQTEEVLRRSEEKFQSLFMHMSEGAAVHELTCNDQGVPEDYVIIEVNPAFESQLGISRDAVIGKTGREAYGVTEPPYLDIYARVALTGEPEIFETCFPPMAKYFSISVFCPHKGSFATVFEDITKRKLAEAELQAVKEKYTKAFLSVPDAITISELDSGRFIEVNDAATGIFGYSRDELMGKSALELGIWQKKEDRDYFIDEIRKHGRVSRFEVLERRKSGELFCASVNADTISLGNVPCLIAVICDITERKKVEDALRENEEKSRSLLESVPELIMVHRNGIILYANPAAVNSLGYRPDEAIDRRITDFIAPEFHERVAGAVRRRMEGKPVDPYEIDIIGKDGSRRNMIVNGSPIEFEGATASLIVLTDITERRKVEEKLKRSEARLRAVVEDQTEFICRFTPDGRLTFVNDAYCRYFGLERTQCLAQSHRVVLPPEDARLMKKHLASLTRENPVAAIDHRIIMSSGEVRWQRWNDRAIFDKNGRVIEYQSVGRDITETKLVEIALHESEERFSQIAESAGEWIWEVDADGVYTYSNAMVYQILGYMPEEIIKRKHFYDLFVPEDRDQVKAEAFRAFTNHEPFKGFMNAYLHKNGDRVVLATSGVPVLDARGNLSGYRGTVIDVTARMNAEEVIRRAGAYNRSLIETSLDPLVTINPEGKISDVNEATVNVTGFSRTELIGTDFSRYFTEPDRAKTGYETVFRDGSVRDYALEIQHRDGHTVPVLYNATVFRDESGTIAGVFAAARDITERKKVEDALKERERELADIVSFMPDATLVIDKNGTVLAWNRAMEEMTGVPADQILGKADYEYALPFYHERRPITADLVLHFDPAVATQYPFIKKEGDSLLSEIYIPHLNKGSGAYLWFKASPLYDAAGNLSGSIETIRDITDSKRAEEALRESEERYHEFFATSRDSIYISTPEGRWIDFNDALLEMFGYSSREEMFEIPVVAIYAHPEERSAFNQLILRQGYVKEYPVELQQKDGTVIDTLITTVVARNPDGSAKAFIGSIRNVTEKKHAEEEIRSLQQFQQNIINNANVWISVLDPKGTILVWNTTAEQISGFSARDVIGTNTIWKQLYPDPAYRRQVLENILEIVKKNTYVENFETRIRTRGGNEKIIWWNTQPVRDAQGKPVQFITIGRDYTERKLAEERLQTLRQFEESVIKNANIWISVLDGKGNVRIWNRAAEEISGYTADEVIGKNTVWSRMYPDKVYRRSVTALIKKVIGDRRYLENFETRIRTKNGQERIIWWNTRILQDVFGIEETFIAIGKDVTEEKTLNDALRQANKQLNLLSSVTRHDILNLLIALRGYIELSWDFLEDKEKLAEFLEKEETAARTIEEQITFTRDYQDLGIAVPEWQNVNTLVQKAVAGLPMRDIRVEVDRSDLEIYADPLFRKVFHNMIENALNYGGGKMKTIRVSSHESDRGLAIVCEDDGVGISSDDKKHLFTRGFGKHTGLGLFLSREILAITGITITEDSEPGKGARFRITVPEGAYRFTGNKEK